MAITATANEILIYGPIDTATATEFARALRTHPRAVTVRVNSPGGDVFAGSAIHAMIARHGNVTILVDGLAASAASYLAMAAARVVMAANAMMMIHNPAAATAGESSDHKRMSNLLDGIRDQMVRAYSGKAGIPAARITTMMADETWMDGATAVRLGFADAVEGVVSAAAAHDMAGFDLSAFKQPMPTTMAELATAYWGARGRSVATPTPAALPNVPGPHDAPVGSAVPDLVAVLDHGAIWARFNGGSKGLRAAIMKGPQE